MSLLAVKDVTVQFSGLRAVDHVSFDVPEGAITAVIGPNGAGKTTCFNVIAGALPPTEGDVTFEGRSLIGLAPEQIARAGIARTFQVVRPMLDLTVEENILVGALLRSDSIEAARAKARRAAGLVGLERRLDTLAANLTLPDRKMLELARAVATDPKLLLLDEVMAGLRPGEGDQIVAALRTLNGEGLTILLIEHVMRVVMALAQNVIVLHHGERIAEGTPEAVTRDEKVIESYLGRKAS
jgi:branched-chain amino acid transport system ATP-binding protein